MPNLRCHFTGCGNNKSALILSLRDFSLVTNRLVPNHDDMTETWSLQHTWRFSSHVQAIFVGWYFWRRSKATTHLASSLTTRDFCRTISGRFDHLRSMFTRLTALQVVARFTIFVGAKKKRLYDENCQERCRLNYERIRSISCSNCILDLEVQYRPPTITTIALACTVCSWAFSLSSRLNSKKIFQ